MDQNNSIDNRSMSPPAFSNILSNDANEKVYQNQFSDTVSLGSINSINSANANLAQKRYQIELNLKFLCCSDPKYFNEAFKIYWSRGKKKIDTRTAILKSDTQTARFNDKFSMRTVLLYNEEQDEFKDKPSILQVFQLEKEIEKTQDENSGQANKIILSGKEIEIGQVPFNLAKYGNQPQCTEKLYLNDLKDMYIEINVKSKPVDSGVQQNWKQPQEEPNSIPNSQAVLSKKERRIGKNNEPITEEDFKILEDFQKIENDYLQQIEHLKQEKKEADQNNLEIQQEWQKLQMQPNEFEKIERKFAQLEFGLREKEITIRNSKNYTQIQSRLEKDKNLKQQQFSQNEDNSQVQYKDENSKCCLELLNLQGDLEIIQKLIQEEESLSRQLMSIEKRQKYYFSIPSSNQTQTEKLWNQNYCQMMDEGTKTLVLVSNQEKQQNQSKLKNDKKKGQNEIENIQQVQQPIKITAILRSIPSLFQKQRLQIYQD